MADEVDKANELAELERNAAIRDAQRAAGPVYSGMCHNCCEPLEEGLFCDKDCLFDFEERQSRVHNNPWR